jgi:hypothetical protein
MHESKQNTGVDEVESDIGDEFANVELELGTPIPDSPEALMFELPGDCKNHSDEED